MRKLQEVLWNMKKDSKEKKNKGFSLVELIIVIAIMAILVGIVGTQVIPYLQRSRESKDLQIINSYSTAAVTAYSSNVEKLTLTGSLSSYTDANGNTVTGGKGVSFSLYASSSSTDTTLSTLYSAIVELVGYEDDSDLHEAMSSNQGGLIEDVQITIDVENQLVTVRATSTDSDFDTDFAVTSNI